MGGRRLALAFLVGAVAALGAALSRTSAAPATPLPYVYIPVPDKIARFRWGNEVCVGTLDARGNFHVQEKLPVSELNVPLRKRVKGPIISFPEPQRVYEFRSGRLILGTMMPDGEFIPEAGSKVIKIEDYRYLQDPGIWNLPGYFKKKSADNDGKK
ncbi:MAG TPA: hypothetical protein VGF55_15955 [Gemmataceae bacterium]|jgi:hypothetical protein